MLGIVKILRKNKMYILPLFFIGLFLDLNYFLFTYDFIFFPTIILWIGFIFLYKFDYLVTFKVLLGVLGLLFILYLVDTTSAKIDRLVAWIFFLFAIGIIHQYLSLSRKS